jgi:amino acid adenylation domain-containing protein
MSAQDIEDIYGLTPLQAGMIFHTLLEPESQLYFEQILVPFDGSIDRTLLERASTRVSQHNSILRTSFHWQETDKPVQVVHRCVRVPVGTSDFSSIAAHQRDSMIMALMTEDRRQGFDLGRPPLFRIHLVKMQSQKYLMLLSFHHAILDGWSLQLLFRQLSDTYLALSRGQEPILPPAQPYRNYIRWLNRQDIAVAQQYWRQTLEGFEGTSRLPLRAYRSGRPEDYGAEETMLMAETTAAVRQFAARQALTLNTLVQAAWALMLRKLTGSNDVVFGATVSGRPGELGDIDTLMGLFINTVPVRVRIKTQAPLLAWLKELQSNQLDARQYDFSSLVQIQEWARIPSGIPLFETIIAFENYPIQASSGAPAAEATFVERTNYPLSACVVPGEQLKLRLLYDRRTLGDDAARLIGQQYWAILASLARTEGRLRDLDSVADEDRALVARVNETNSEFPSHTSLATLFEQQAAAIPDALAIEFDGSSMTYRELDTRANRLAHRLKKLGVIRGDHVCLLLESGAELVVAMLGVLKAGAAYVPLDLGYPPARIDEIIDDTRARLLILDEHTVDRQRSTKIGNIVLDRACIALADEPTGAPSISGRGTDVAYIMFTSGSTGRPKGVAVPHMAIVGLVRNTNYIELRPGDRIAQASNCAFDAATFEIWGPLLNGATLVGIDRDTLLSPGLLATTLRERRIDVLFLTTAVFNQTALQTPDAFSTLNVLIFGGEAVDARIVREVLGSAPPRRLLHAYGPTEGTTFATIHEVAATSGEIATVPIGRPISNTTAYVLDSSLKPVAPGQVGELHVGGRRLAYGYHARAALTAEHFVPDPFSKFPGARLYCTGDKVRWLADGTIEFIGRYDHQVKLRGYRIELGEIEQRLLQVPAVREAVVLLRKDATEEPYLAAYVVPRNREESVLQEMQTAMRQSLPTYMQPRTITLLPALPLNENGKLNRAVLPDPIAGGTVGMEDGVKPRTDTEIRLAKLWSEVLDYPEPLVNDEFFQLGGHSLRATQLVSRIHREFGAAIPLRAIFEKPTIAEQAALLDSYKPSAAAAPPTIAAAARTRRVL